MDWLLWLRGSAHRSSPSISSVTPVSITPAASRQSLPSTSDASSSPSMQGSVRRQLSTLNRVQPLHARDAQLQERSKLDIWMLGLTIVIGGQYYSWNAGLTAGVLSYCMAFVLVTVGYVILCCCTAEVTGALPFSGGAYGLSRCTLGFFPGFMIGCCEALEYIAYVATTTILLGDLIIDVVPDLDGYAPLIWLVFYLSALAIQIPGGRLFWRFNLIIGGVSLLIVIVYVVGALPWVDFAQHTAPDPHVGFVGGFSGFMRAFPLAAWFFVGVEAVTMASDDVHHPKTIVPKAQVYCVLTLAVTGLCVYCVTVSLPRADGGIAELATYLSPLDQGFQLLFGIPKKAATLFSLPATYATAFGFIWCYGKVISAMATSRLLPPFLAKSTITDGVPYMALLVGSGLSYALCVLVYLVPTISTKLFSICITAAFVAYSGQCIGYISMKKNYRNIKSSSFASPFGIPGAVVSLIIWITGIVAIAGFQGDSSIEILVFLALVALLVVFYHGYARKRQTFSPQENKVLLVAHVMKFNANRFSGKSKATARSPGPSRATTNHSTNVKPNSLASQANPSAHSIVDK